MQLIKKRTTASVIEPKSFIDLGEMPLVIPAETDARVKIIEIRTIEDISVASDLAYKGNILFIRCALPEENKKSAMDTITAELKRITKDCGGDMIIIGDSFVLMTTNGVKIDNLISKRKKKI
jgi:SepF-like predicted cell division protein (DUF552 family)